MLPVSIASIALGIILVLIAEFGEVHETRIFGAALITGGGTGIGIHTGLADPRAWRGWTLLRSRRLVLALVGTALAVLPVLVVLAGALVGVAGDADGDRGGLALLLGVLVAVAMALAVLATALVSVKAMTRAVAERPRVGGDPGQIEGEGTGP